MPHYCNEEQCKYCENQVCTLNNTYHVERFCVSYRKKPRQDNFNELMKAPFNPHCSKSSNGKYKSNNLNVLK